MTKDTLPSVQNEGQGDIPLSSHTYKIYCFNIDQGKLSVIIWKESGQPGGCRAELYPPAPCQPPLLQNYLLSEAGVLSCLMVRLALIQAGRAGKKLWLAPWKTTVCDLPYMQHSNIVVGHTGLKAPPAWSAVKKFPMFTSLILQIFPASVGKLWPASCEASLHKPKPEREDSYCFGAERCNWDQKQPCGGVN